MWRSSLGWRNIFGKRWMERQGEKKVNREVGHNLGHVLSWESRKIFQEDCGSYCVECC